jgi:hypothetical protein
VGASETSVLDREKWKVTAEIVRSQPDRVRLLLGSGDEFAPLFYWGRLDFHVTTGGEMDSTSISRATGVRRLLTAADVRAFYPDGGVALVAIDSARLAGGLYDHTLIETLDTEAIELCRGRCGALMLYRWEFGSAMIEGDAPAAASSSLPPRPLRETTAVEVLSEGLEMRTRFGRAPTPVARRISAFPAA